MRRAAFRISKRPKFEGLFSFAGIAGDRRFRDTGPIFPGPKGTGKREGDESSRDRSFVVKKSVGEFRKRRSPIGGKFRASSFPTTEKTEGRIRPDPIDSVDGER